jgi:peptide deformylase
MPLTLWGNPILDHPSVHVLDDEFGDELAELGERIHRVMRNAHGVGLAGPQVGIAKRLFVYDCEGQRGFLANPVIVDRSRDLAEDDEGCLSIPGFAWMTPRAAAVTVEGRDAFGQPITVDASGYFARCMQHEVDHLNGQLFISRLGGRLAKSARRAAKQASWYGEPHRFIPID